MPSAFFRRRLGCPSRWSIAVAPAAASALLAGPTQHALMQARAASAAAGGVSSLPSSISSLHSSVRRGVSCSAAALAAASSISDSNNGGSNGGSNESSIPNATTTTTIPVSPSPSSAGHSRESIPASQSPLFSFSQRDLDLSVPLPPLKYPVVLVHGYLGYASLLRDWNGQPLFEYFGSVRTHLATASGGQIAVLTPVNPPAASIAARAKRLQMALGIQKAGMKEEKIEGRGEATTGQEHTQRRPTGEAAAAPHEKDSCSGSAQHPPLEHCDTLSPSHPGTAAAAAAASSSSSHIDSQTGSVKTAGDQSDMREAARDPTPALLLGGRSVDLQSYRGKFHLIAHSMGGLDARYLISQLQGAESGASNQTGANGGSNGARATSTPGGVNRIASLTTIATPHRGSPVADRILDVIDVPLSFSPSAVSSRTAWTWHKISVAVGERVGIDVTGLSNLSTEALRGFNDRVRNHTDCHYMSYGGARHFHPWSVWWLPSRMIRKAEERWAALGARSEYAIDEEVCGLNDGLVSVSSARWGQYVGTTNLDHLEQIGLGVWNKHLPLYRQIVFRLYELEQEEERRQAEAKAKAAAGHTLRVQQAPSSQSAAQGATATSEASSKSQAA